MPEMTRLDDSCPADSEAGDRSRVGGVGATSGSLPPVPTEVGPEMEVVQLLEEVASVGKHDIVTGRVRIATRTETIEEVVRDTLDGQTIEVERIPLDRVLAVGEAVPQVRTAGDVTIVPVLEEVLVVEKRLKLKEELRIVRRVDVRTFEQSVPLRRQTASVEHLDPKSTKGE